MIDTSAVAQLLLGALVLDGSAELTDIHVRPMRKAGRKAGKVSAGGSGD